MTPNGTVASESDRRDHFKVRSWLIDGEVVCCDERGLARFDVLRRRRNEAVVFLYAFDLLELDGVDLRRVCRLSEKGRAARCPTRRAMSRRVGRLALRCPGLSNRTVASAESPRGIL